MNSSTIGKPLLKTTYLASPIVVEFVRYLSELINGRQITHEITIRDKKLPYKDQRKKDPRFFIDSLEAAFNGYWWNKDGYERNAQKLDTIRSMVRDSLAANLGLAQTSKSLNDLRVVLEWGAGGTGQSLYRSNLIWAENHFDTLTESLVLGCNAMSNDAPNVSVFNPRRTAVYARMNAGFTKYYAMACDDVVIYDGRVGSALGFLVKSFCIENHIHKVPEDLAFRWGAQGGTQPLNRDPSNEIYHFPKLPTEGSVWAEWNIKANWVLRAACNQKCATWCAGKDGLRKIEAALFVIGYSMPVYKRM